MNTQGLLAEGLLLEESLAWLLRFSGYRLLVHEDQVPVELVSEHHPSGPWAGRSASGGCTRGIRVHAGVLHAGTAVPGGQVLPGSLRAGDRTERPRRGARCERELHDAGEDTAAAALHVFVRTVLCGRLHVGCPEVRVSPPDLAGGSVRRFVRLAARPYWSDATLSRACPPAGTWWPGRGSAPDAGQASWRAPPEPARRPRAGSRAGSLMEPGPAAVAPPAPVAVLAFRHARKISSQVGASSRLTRCPRTAWACLRGPLTHSSNERGLGSTLTQP
jgi:hypothetical protein